MVIDPCKPEVFERPGSQFAQERPFRGTRIDGEVISQGIVTGPGAVSLLAGDNLTIEAGGLVTSTATGFMNPLKSARSS